MQLSLLFSLIATVVAAIPRDNVRAPTSAQSSELLQKTPVSSVAAIANNPEKTSSLSEPLHATSAPSANIGHASTFVVMSISMLPVTTSAHAALATESASQDALHASSRKAGKANTKVSHVTASVVQRDADQMVIEYPLSDVEPPIIPALQTHQPKSLQTSSAKPSPRKSSVKSSKPPVTVSAPAQSHTSTSQVVKTKPSPTQSKARSSVQHSARAKSLTRAASNARYTSSARSTIQPSTPLTNKPAVTSTGYAKPAPSSTSRTTLAHTTSYSISTTMALPSATTSIPTPSPSPMPSPSPSPLPSSVSTAITSSKYGSEQDLTSSTPIVSASSTLAEPEPSEDTPSPTSSELSSSITSSQSVEPSATSSTEPELEPSSTSAYTAETRPSTLSTDVPSPTSAQLPASPTLTPTEPETQSYSAQSSATTRSTTSIEQPSSVLTTSQLPVSYSASVPTTELPTSLLSSASCTHSSTPPTSSASLPTLTATQPATTSSASPASSSASAQTSATSSPIILPTYVSEASYSASEFIAPDILSSYANSQPIYWSSMPYSMSTASPPPPPPSPVQYIATPDIDNFYVPTSSQPGKMDINVNLMLTVDYAGEVDRAVSTGLSQSNATPSARIVYESPSSSSSSYSSTTTTTITVYPTSVPTSPKGYTTRLDSTTARRNHYHHHLRASVETYLLPNDEASAISNAMHFKNKVEHISEFLEPTPAMTIEEEYLVATVDN